MRRRLAAASGLLAAVVAGGDTPSWPCLVHACAGGRQKPAGRPVSPADALACAARRRHSEPFPGSTLTAPCCPFVAALQPQRRWAAWRRTSRPSCVTLTARSAAASTTRRYGCTAPRLVRTARSDRTEHCMRHKDQRALSCSHLQLAISCSMTG
eukprot:364187-Chlamydomonas_euryale.AAC.6